MKIYLAGPIANATANDMQYRNLVLGYMTNEVYNPHNHESDDVLEEANNDLAQLASCDAVIAIWPDLRTISYGTAAEMSIACYLGKPTALITTELYDSNVITVGRDHTWLDAMVDIIVATGQYPTIQDAVQDCVRRVYRMVTLIRRAK